MTLRPVVHAFGLARSASDASEDAYAVEAAAGVVALADGASSAWRAGDWAATLVASWVAAPPAATRRPGDGGYATAFARWVAAAREAFRADDVTGEDRPWFAEAAAERGAHAAFAGLLLGGLDRRPRYRTFAVGDVCCFHVRDDRLLSATPLDDPDRFTSRPDLISSRSADPVPDAVITTGELREDDMLLLASDALAAFLLHLAGSSEPVWRLVSRLDTIGFRTLVTRGIDAGLLERDDATLVRIVLRRADVEEPA